MAQSFIVPASVKIRLCQPVEKTVNFAQLIEASGASWITLHARTVSAKRRRQGAANLEIVKQLKEALRIPVISNGNVRTWNNVTANLEYTGADGVMVGETLLGNPWSVTLFRRGVYYFLPLLTLVAVPIFSLFANELPDPVDIALEYLGICTQFPDTVPVTVMQTHIRHIIEFQWLVPKQLVPMRKHRPSFRTFLMTVVDARGSRNTGPY